MFDFDYNLGRRDRWVEECAQRVPDGSRVLDVGAGMGRYRPCFDHCEYRAHDFAQEPETKGKYTPLDYVSDIAELPIEAESFDVVLCTEVLEHVPEPIVALREMARVLRPGGKLLLSAPLGSHLHQEPFHFYGGYTPHWYRRYLTEFGLEVVALERNGGFFTLFGQEARRFSALVGPRSWRSLGDLLVMGPVWFVTLPFCRLLFPGLSTMLDGRALEAIATIGYHVEAIKAVDTAPGRDPS